MVTDGEASYSIRHDKVGSKKYVKHFIYLAKDVAEDSGFPFKEGMKLKVRIEGNKLLIEVSKEGEK